MEDVPAADTFSVEDMIAVRFLTLLPCVPRIPLMTHCDTTVIQVKSLGPNEVSVEANFEVKWIKSTIFRRMIESNTNPDVTKVNRILACFDSFGDFFCFSGWKIFWCT
jgi:hypothetical protein